MSGDSADYILLTGEDPAWGPIEVELRAAGYPVARAAGREPALTLLRQRQPDLALAHDLDTCRALRAHVGVGGPAVVLVAPRTALPPAEQLVLAGADDVVATPIEPAELLLRVRSLLGRRHRQERIENAPREHWDLILMLAHDLKNSISTILVNGNLISAAADLPESLRESSSDILDAAAVMNRLVANLQHIHRREDGLLVPRFAPVELAALAEVAAAAKRRQAADRLQTIEVVNRIDGRYPIVGDRELLSGLLENLLDDALRYSPRRGEIRIELAAVDDDWVELHVCDQGPGVPAVWRERIFDQAFQLDRETAAQARASRGLGLTFCRLAAEVHGGSIRVDDDEPSGCRFSVRLPTRPSNPLRSR